MTTFSFSSRKPYKPKPKPHSIGFICPYCAAPGTEVRDSRATEGGRIRRRRTCVVCNSRFSTIEVMVDELPSIDLTRLTLKTSTSLNLFIKEFNELRRAVKTSARRLKEEPT